MLNPLLLTQVCILFYFIYYVFEIYYLQIHIDVREAGKKSFIYVNDRLVLKYNGEEIIFYESIISDVVKTIPDGLVKNVDFLAYIVLSSSIFFIE